jgi:hypothetical protein
MIKTLTEWNEFHMNETNFNKLENKERLLYLLSKFHIGMDISVRVGGGSVKTGTVYGFHKSGTTISSLEYEWSWKLLKEEVIDDEYFINNKVPSSNIIVNINGELESYYPLWVRPDYVKIRNKKLESIGI